MEPQSIFADKHKFKDDVWGQIRLNDLERDVIDTPEFQRLFRTSQMGFVDLVYQTANHTRGTHALGACHISKMLMDHLNSNTEQQSELDIKISPAEQILIRVGALLHDISHIPLSHDLEKKTHKIFYTDRSGNTGSLQTRSDYGFYDKHDDYEHNPHLYLLLCDEESVLARLLRRYSKEFHALLRSDGTQSCHNHLREFVSRLSKTKDAGWDPDLTLLPDLLFHLLTYEKPDDAAAWERKLATKFGENGTVVMSPWGLGPTSLRRQLHSSWYQPFRHDIIGNTLSADLIVYLRRDAQRLGIDRHADQYLLNYYVLVRSGSNGDSLRYRCAIDLRDHKRGTPRVGLVNDIFRLLDLRHEIHEKAVMHRVVQAANAMLSRALLLLDKRPTTGQMLKIGDRIHSLQGDESFFQELLRLCENNPRSRNTGSVNDARRILRKLIDRRVYRPLLIIPGDRAARHLSRLGKSNDISGNTEYRLRSLAAILDSRYYSNFLLFVSACVEKFLQGAFSSHEELCTFAQTYFQTYRYQDYIKQVMKVIPSRVILWTSPYKQLYKDPEVVVALDGWVGRIDLLKSDKISGRNEPVVDRVQKAIEDADSKYATLWKLYVFISDGLFYTGTISRLKEHVAGRKISENELLETHRARLKKAQGFIIAALDSLWEDWTNLWVRFKPEENSQQLKDCLERAMDVENFKDLVGLWVALYRKKYRSVEDPASELSTVDINHYIHGDPLVGPLGTNCRDIRYKTDVSAVNKWRQALANKSGPDYELVRFLEGLGMNDSTVISELEFEQLCETYDRSYNDTSSLLRLLGHDPDSPGSALVHLCLAGFPWPADKVSQEPKQPLPSSEDIAIAQAVPQTPEEIQNWLLEQAVILQTNVRRQLTTDLAPIIAYIESKPVELRPDILADLRSRFRNESTLIYNEIKSEQIVNALKHKWG